MTPWQETRLQQFLANHHADLVAVFEQAYTIAGGHYAALSPTARRQQAEIDSHEFCIDLLAGSINQTLIAEVIQLAANSTALARDLIHMVMALDPLICAFIRVQLRDDPLVAAELEQRTRAIVRTFRSGVLDAQIGYLLGRMQRAQPDA